MKLEFDPLVPAEVSAAFTILNALNALKAKSGAADAGNASAPGTTAPAPSAPPPAAPAASSTPPAAPASPPPAAPPAAPPASAPPAAAPPASPPPPPAAASGMSAADFSKLVSAYAQVHTPKGAKARFTQLAEAYSQPTWTSTGNLPVDKLEELAAWFTV